MAEQVVGHASQAVPDVRSGLTLPSDEASAGLNGRVITVMIRYFAAARAAAGLSEEQLSVPVLTRDSGPQDPNPGDLATVACAVGAVLDAAVHRHGPGLATVLQRCSFLLDEIAVHGPATPVRDGQVLDVLPPFAGG